MKAYFSKNLFSIVIVLTLAITIAITFQKISAPVNTSDLSPKTAYNNYLIFKSAGAHLLEGKDLYQLYPEDHFDYYKYSPVFALLMCPFNVLPNWLGLLFWNLLNVFVLVFAISRLPQLSNLNKAGILLIGLFEQIGATMNSQSNLLMVGFMILTVTSLEKEKPFWAALFLMASAYIKVFSLIIGVFFLFYQKKGKFILSCVFWFMLFALLPIVVTGWKYLFSVYQSWWVLLQSDFDSSTGYSVAGILFKWFHWEPQKMAITLAGTFLFLIPLFRVNNYHKLQYRMLYLANALIWVIIFNHKAESPTFIIAMTGIAICFFYDDRSTLSWVLLISSILLVSIVYSDAVPTDIRNSIFHQYVIKAFPCIVIWLYITYKITLNRQRLK